MRGRDVERYGHNWDKTKLWLIATFPSLKLDIDRYPVVKKYLLSFGKERLEQTGRTFPDGTKSRKKTTHNWYELQDTCAYHAEFERDKIVYREISDSLNATYIEATEPSIFVNNKLYIITGGSLKYLLACLNSKVMSFILNNANFGGGKGRGFLGNISVPQTTQREQQPIIDLVNQILDTKAVSPNTDTMYMEAEIEQLVYQLYGLTDSEIRTIENYFLSSTKSISASVKP